MFAYEIIEITGCFLTNTICRVVITDCFQSVAMMIQIAITGKISERRIFLYDCKMFSEVELRY